MLDSFGGDCFGDSCEVSMNQDRNIDVEFVREPVSYSDVEDSVSVVDFNYGGNFESAITPSSSEGNYFKQFSFKVDYTPQNVHRNLQNLKQQPYVSDRNAELLEEFVRELQAREETSDSRCCWYISKFSTLLKRYINQDKVEDLSTDDLDQLTKSDMVKIIGELKGDEEKNYVPKTVNGFKTSLKMFYKLRHPVTHNRPDRVKTERNAERKTFRNLKTRTRSA